MNVYETVSKEAKGNFDVEERKKERETGRRNKKKRDEETGNVYR